MHVDVDLDTAWERATRNSDRPLARDRERFAALHERRRPLYDSLARAVVTGGQECRGRLGGRAAAERPGVPPAVRMLWSRAGAGHPVYVGVGALGAAGALWPGAGARFLVADEHALALHGEPLLASLVGSGEVAETIAVPPGERHKSLAEAERVLRALARAGMQRTDTLVALGGGVVGDLGRFLRRHLPARRVASCRCRRPSSRRSTPPTAARPGSTCPRRRTTWARSTSPPR